MQVSQKLERKMSRIKADRDADLDPLNSIEIEQAEKVVAMEQPLKNIPIWVTLPYLRPIKKWLPKCLLWEEKGDNKLEDNRILEIKS